MLEFTCSTCGKRVQVDDAFAGQHVRCPVCNGTMTGAPNENSFREGEPPYQHGSPLPAVREEAELILMRGCAGGILTVLTFTAIGFGLVFLPLAAFSLLEHGQDGIGWMMAGIFNMAVPLGI